MGQDVSAELAGLISGSKVFGASDNIRHGKYTFLIKRIFADMVETDKGNNKMAFWEFTVLKAEPNPQIEGDHVDYPGSSGPLKDDGTKPNGVGTSCALKVNFDGPGGRSAGSNIKAAILALFNLQDGQVPDAEINNTWVDLSRRKSCKKGDIVGFDAATNQPIHADKDKLANPACGMVINCTTMSKKKKTANDKGAYVTKLIWSCAAPIGTGENSPELVAKRRAEVEASSSDDDEVETAAVAAPQALPAVQVAPTVAPPAPPAVPAPPVAPAVFTPSAPWVKHPTAFGATPETRFFWSNPQLGGDNSVKSEVQLRAGQ
jgi:hypothetical protein